MDDPVRNPYLSTNPSDEAARGGGSGGSLVAHVRTGQIITFALVQGVVLIGAVMAYLALDAPANPVPPGATPAGEDFILPAIGIAVAVSCWIAALIVSSVMRRKAADQLSESGEKVDLPYRADALLTASIREFLAASQTATIVGQAACEGAAVANLILMLVDGNWIHLPFAVICVIGIAVQVPTTGKLQNAIEVAVRPWNGIHSVG